MTLPRSWERSKRSFAGASPSSAASSAPSSSSGQHDIRLRLPAGLQAAVAPKVGSGQPPVRTKGIAAVCVETTMKPVHLPLYAVHIISVRLMCAQGTATFAHGASLGADGTLVVPGAAAGADIFGPVVQKVLDLAWDVVGEGERLGSSCNKVGLSIVHVYAQPRCTVPGSIDACLCEGSFGDAVWQVNVSS